MSEIQDLEHDIREAEALVQRRKDALKLSENPEFKKLFMEEYFVKEAARFVQIAGDPNLTKDQRDDAIEMAKATGHAKRWLSAAIQMGAHYEGVLPQMYAELDELRALEGAE